MGKGGGNTNCRAQASMDAGAAAGAAGISTETSQAVAALTKDITRVCCDYEAAPDAQLALQILRKVREHMPEGAPEFWDAQISAVTRVVCDYEAAADGELARQALGALAETFPLGPDDYPGYDLADDDDRSVVNADQIASMLRPARAQSPAAKAQTAAARGERPAPIFRQLSLDQTRNNFDGLIRELRDGDLNVDPPYQRGHVWGQERQRNLIRSLTMGLPVGSIYLNERDIMEPTVVVDGKQRLEAVRAWMDSELEVPAHWFPAENTGGTPLIEEAARGKENIRYSDLTRAGQLGWRNNAGILVNRSKFQGPDAEAKEAELFSLINFGGVAQGESDAQPAASKPAFTGGRY